MNPEMKRGGLTPSQTRLGWAIIFASLLGPLTCSADMSFGPLHDLVDIESLAFNTIFCLIIGWPVAMALLAIGAVVLGKRV